MQENILITFKVTEAQYQTIALRAAENGFDDIPCYIKVVALHTQAFKLTSALSAIGTPSKELSFQVTPAQNAKIEANMKESGCEQRDTYLEYVALHGVVSAVVEVRSTGTLDSMLARISASKKK